MPSQPPQANRRHKVQRRPATLSFQVRRVHHLVHLFMPYRGISPVLPLLHHLLMCPKKLSTAHSDLTCYSLRSSHAVNSSHPTQMLGQQQQLLWTLSAQSLAWSLLAKHSIQSCKMIIQHRAGSLHPANCHVHSPIMPQTGKTAACQQLLNLVHPHHKATTSQSTWIACTHRQHQQCLHRFWQSKLHMASQQTGLYRATIVIPVNGPMLNMLRPCRSTAHLSSQDSCLNLSQAMHQGKFLSNLS